MTQKHFDNKSPLVQVITWCHQSTRHCLCQSSPRPISPYSVARPRDRTAVVSVATGFPRDVCMTVSRKVSISIISVVHMSALLMKCKRRVLLNVWIHGTNSNLKTGLQWTRLYMETRVSKTSKPESQTNESSRLSDAHIHQIFSKCCKQFLPNVCKKRAVILYWPQLVKYGFVLMVSVICAIQYTDAYENLSCNGSRQLLCLMNISF